MPQQFIIALRESFQASLLLALVLFSPPVAGIARLRRSVLVGFAAAFVVGFTAGSVPFLSTNTGAHETWTFWRHAAVVSVFYSAVAVQAARSEAGGAFITAGAFLLGFVLVFFESRTLGFIIYDLGAMSGRITASFAFCAAGIVLGSAPFVIAKNKLRSVPFERIFTPATLLVSVGSLQLVMGGLSELGGESVMVPLQRSLQLFVNESMKSIQSAMLLTEHPFLHVPFTETARYFGSDRTALSLTVIFLTAPPVFLLITLFSRPDPVVSDISGSARRRKNIAGFRQDLTLQAAPVLASFIALVVQLHAVNVSLNPLYDPEPIPVQESEGTSVIRIPLSEKGSDLKDKKLRKYVYYEGSKQVLFIAIMKADGSVGVALDQCEICRPADWNKDAKGYAQKGENLICKYCVTPIAANTVNTPGGCNPIPVPFRIEENAIVINRSELVSIFDKAEALERKGTHL